MIESNPIQGWQDETLALKIEELFHKLKTLVAAGKMPHYFMRKSNMLAGIPQHKLQNVSERIYRIRENFVFFLINILKVRNVYIYGRRTQKNMKFGFLICLIDLLQFSGITI